ncbi:hypothetical protein APT98_26440 [Klebsiella quasipneumoniae]|nr:hypothetical protein APT98_26440 [Klebsiella quasipneumoniae]
MSAGEIARSLEAQDAKFSDDFMEQFHDEFLTQVQFDNAILCDTHHIKQSLRFII